MNLLKNMEAVFAASVALAVSASYLLDALPSANASAAATASAAHAIPVVVVKARRMTPAEKQQSLQAERESLASARTPASRI